MASSTSPALVDSSRAAVAVGGSSVGSFVAGGADLLGRLQVDQGL